MGARGEEREGLDVLARPDGVTAGGERLDLSSTPILGQVVRLDRNGVEVEVSDPALVSRVTVSDLVAVPFENTFLIGLVETVGGQDGAPGSATDGEGRSVARLRVMLFGTFTAGEGSAGGTFERGAHGFPHLGDDCHLLHGEGLRRFLSVLGSEVAPGQRLLLGHFLADLEVPAIADGNRLFQRHVALLGNTGAGKSWAVARILEQAARLSHANLVVFDLHGEYETLTRRANSAEPVARSLRVAGPADLGQVGDELLYLPYWFLDRDELMTLVLNADDPNASDHVFRFTEIVQTLKQISLMDADRVEAVPTFTVNSPVPYKLSHLVRKLRDEDTEKIAQPPSMRLEPGPFFGRLGGFVTRIEARAGDPRFGFIFNPPDSALTSEWLTETAEKLLGGGAGRRGIKIVDLSEVPSAIVPLVVGVLARLVFNVQFWMPAERRTPICLVCDEAHLYLPPREESGRFHGVALQAFESIAKEGRKYGVSLLVVSQRPTDVSGTILSQCNNFVVMRLTNDRDRAMVERLIPETLAGVTSTLPALEPGEAVVIGDALLFSTRVRLDPPETKPASGTLPYWSQWAERASSPDAIAAGVDALRNQFRPLRAT